MSVLFDNQIIETFDNIIKSNEDNREYKAIVLKNGLKVVVISDSETDISAAALDVNVGSMCEPSQIPGLAHFLEHMLFMGTEKYQGENEYDQYLSRNGGTYNACTLNANTRYFFDVSPNHLSGALDRFGQFFIGPLLTESATDREINAVDSEFGRCLDDDEYRISQVLSSLTDPNHEFSRFNIGNNETLKERPLKEGINIREALLEFHKKWYSANIMSLVVLGKETIEELIELVVPLFSQIENKSVSAPEWPTNPLTDEYLRKCISIVPIKDTKELRIHFPFPDLNPYYKSEPGHYITHLVGHKGPGSLLSELKYLQLCSSLSAEIVKEFGYESNFNGFSFFEITFELTNEGIERTDHIITLFFQYLNLIKKECPQEWIFEEEKRLKKIKFEFADKEKPYHYVLKLSQKLQYFPINECLSANSLIEEFKPKLITDLLNKLTPNQMRYSIIGKKFNGITDSTEKWFGTQYKVEDIPQHKIDLWTNCGQNEKLFLPPINDFIPSNLNITKREENIKSLPQILRDTEFCRVWYLKDNQYFKPKAFYGFILRNPLVYTDSLHTNSSALFIRLFIDSIEEYCYSAKLSGLSFCFENTSYGLIFEFEGYNHKLSLFLERLLKKLIDFKIDSKRFDVIKEKYVRELKNFSTQPLYELLSHYTSLITTERFWCNEELLETVSDVTIDGLEHFIPQLLSRFHIETLIHGNIESSEALEISDLVENIFKSSHFKTRSIPLSQHFMNREIELSAGKSFLFSTTSEVHQTKAIQIYIQIGVQTTISNASLDLVKQLLNEPSFDTLRTKEQLGYLVWCRSLRSNGVQGLTFIIESDYNPLYLNERIEAFISWSEKYIRDMSDEEFETEKQSLITRKLQKTKQLTAYSKKLWKEIQLKQYNFDRDQIEVNAIKQLTKSDIIEFFQKYLSNESINRKKLMVNILSSNPRNDPIQDKTELLSVPNIKETVPITNLMQFKNMCPLYALPQPFINV